MTEKIPMKWRGVATMQDLPTWCSKFADTEGKFIQTKYTELLEEM